MKIEKEVYNLEKSANFEEVDFTLDPSSKELMLELLHSSLYSNPKGSLVRELASNCVDAHKEGNISKPFEIEYVERNKLTGQFEPCIIFRDFAGLLTPQRFKDVYTKYFASTKRGSNEEIGGWGLGAKSPLAYVDSFTVRSVNNKTDYTYVVAKSETSGIKLFKLHEEPTNLGNMTEVIIPLNDTSDKNDFIREINNQLSYFKNVKYIGWGTAIENIKIEYEDDDVVYSPDCPFDNTHIVLGGVSYPIDYSLIDFNSLGVRYTNSLGLKFNIGELKVSLNRETIYYTDKTKQAIIDKITRVSKRIFEDLTKSLKEETNFLEVIKKLESFGRGNYANGHGVKENFANFCSWSKGNKGIFTFENVDIDSAYTCLKGFQIQLVSFDYSGRVNYNKFDVRYLQDYDIYFAEQERSIKKSKCIYRIGKNGQKNKTFALIEPIKYDPSNFADKALFDHAVEVQSNVCALLRRDAINYDNYVVDESIFEEEDRKQLYTKAELREMNKSLYAKILYSNFSNGYNPAMELEFTSFEPVIKDIPKIKSEKIIYGFKDDDEKLKNVGMVLYNSRIYKDSFPNCRGCKLKGDEKVIVLKISRDKEKYFLKCKNAIHVDKFLMSGTKELITFYTGYLIERVLNRYQFLQYFEKFNSTIYGKYQNLKKYSDKYLSYKIDQKDNFVKNVLLFCEENKVWDKKVIKVLNELEDYCQGLEILSYIKASTYSFLDNKQIACIQDLLAVKGKQITYTGKLYSSEEEAKKKGRAAVMQEFLSMEGIRNRNQIDEYKHITSNFYKFKGEARYRAVSWIRTLPMAKLDLDAPREEEQKQEDKEVHKVEELVEVLV